MNSNSSIVLSENIKNAFQNNEPIVALESTIISHGMPYPQNFETALKIEATVRKAGAVPATIAIINGKIKIGLSDAELEFFAKEKNILKASRRDIAIAVSQKLNAATTVSATMICAKLASIKIFATGGIGGVHRGAEISMDISADLFELAHTNIAVVSAGVKSILDIGLTLEYLETMGVPVIGFKTEDFPAFFTNKSGFKTNYKIDTEKEIADIIKSKYELGISGGVLIANSIPEKYSLDKKFIDDAIENSIRLAEKNNIKGKDVTPFLLSKINELTKGKSLDANIQLVLNNAELAAKIAFYIN